MIAKRELLGNGLVLRPNATPFAGELHAAAMESLATVGRWMPWCHPGRTEVDGREWYAACDESWRTGREYEFTIFSTAGDFLGAAGLNQFNTIHNFANLGYWVRQSQQGQGVAAEAARVLAAFGFGVLHLARIEIVIAVDNIPSRRVAEKLGATFEGVARRRIQMRGDALDAAMYSLVPFPVAAGGAS